MENKYEEINIMLDAMKKCREESISNIRHTLKNNGLLKSTRDLLNIEVHRLEREIETLEEVRMRCKFIF